MAILRSPRHCLSLNDDFLLFFPAQFRAHCSCVTFLFGGGEVGQSSRYRPYYSYNWDGDIHDYPLGRLRGIVQSA